jgi:hypothetical protein
LTRAVWPVRNTSVVALCPPSGHWLPTESGDAAPLLVHTPSTVTESPGSYRIESAASAPSSRPASAATAAKTSCGAAAWATSVATRRSAACSSATRASAAWLSALAIAVATSSVNEARRASASAGSGSSRVEPAPIVPHVRPSTTTGVAITERTPILRARSASEPVAPTWLSALTGPPVSNAAVAMFFPSRVHRLPTGMKSTPLPQLAT